MTSESAPQYGAARGHAEQGDHGGTQRSGTGHSSAVQLSSAERRRRRDAAFGDTAMRSSSDDIDPAERSGFDESYWSAQKPPHHS